MNKKKSLILLIIWMIVIFIFSSMDSSSSSNLSRGLTLFFFNIKNIELIKKYEFYIRKFAHVFEYFVLVILAYNYFKNNNKYKYLYSLLLCFIYACSDEIHQLFVSGRAGLFQDVLIDMIGVLLFLIFMFIKNKYASTRKSS